MTVAEKKNYIEIAVKYAEDVKDKKKLACKWTILSCERFLEDIERSNGDWPFALSDKANIFCRAIERMPHVHGTWSSPMYMEHGVVPISFLNPGNVL
jgi:phage terminase large subunit-like protein